LKSDQPLQTVWRGRDPQCGFRHQVGSPCRLSGLTISEARRSAIGEALERYCAARADLDRIIVSPLDQLDGNVLDPRLLVAYTDDQLRRKGFPYRVFIPERPHAWITGTRLDTGEPIWAPALPTYFELPSGLDDEYCQVTTSGLAAGACLEDALSHAILELIERDAVAISWLTRQPGRRIILDDSLDPGAHLLVRQLASHGAHVELYLLHSDTEIAAVACLVLGNGKDWPGVTFSSAAHPDPRQAVRAAILEQGFSGTFLRDVLIQEERPVPERREDVRTVMDHAQFYFPEARASCCDFLRRTDIPPVPLRQVPQVTGGTLNELVFWLARRNVHVAAVDVTSADIAITGTRVVRALAPELLPIYFGFGNEPLAHPALIRRLGRASPNLDPHPHC